MVEENGDESLTLDRNLALEAVRFNLTLRI